MRTSENPVQRAGQHSMLKKYRRLATSFKRVVHPVSSRLWLQTLWQLRFYSSFIRAERVVLWRAVSWAVFCAVGDAVESELVTIFGFECMTLHRVSVLGYQLGLVIWKPPPLSSLLYWKLNWNCDCCYYVSLTCRHCKMDALAEFNCFSARVFSTVAVTAPIHLIWDSVCL